MEDEHRVVELPTFTHLWKMSGKLYTLGDDMTLPVPLNFKSALAFVGIFTPIAIIIISIDQTSNLTAWGITLAFALAISFLYDKQMFGGRTFPDVVHDYGSFWFTKKAAYDLIDGPKKLGKSSLNGEVFVPDFDPITEDIVFK